MLATHAAALMDILNSSCSSYPVARWSETVFKFALPILYFLSIPAYADEDLDRPGKGEWCYNPTKTLGISEKAAFVSEVKIAAYNAEARWGVPAAILTGMAVVESGYGTTRLAIKANNIFAFKWPGASLARGAKRFTLECQPVWDEGNVYPAFLGRAEAVDFVAWRLNESAHYSDATTNYLAAVKRGDDRQSAAIEWLKTIAPTYNYDARKYVPAVLKTIVAAKNELSIDLWSALP